MAVPGLSDSKIEQLVARLGGSVLGTQGGEQSDDVRGWFRRAETLARAAQEDAQAHRYLAGQLLDQLEEVLRYRVFLVGDGTQATAADVTMGHALQSVVQALPHRKKQVYCNVLRWHHFLQRRLGWPVVVIPEISNWQSSSSSSPPPKPRAEPGDGDAPPSSLPRPSLSVTRPPIWVSPNGQPLLFGPVRCPICADDVALVFSELTDLHTHLITAHNVLIPDINRIPDVYAYMQHWRTRLADQSLQEVAPLAVSPASPAGPTAQHHVLPDDQLVQELLQHRVAAVVNAQRAERLAGGFARPCPLCQRSIDSAEAMLAHLAQEHAFHLGSPEHLVFVATLCDALTERIAQNVCVYCERTFKSGKVLRQHMRKKKHLRIASSNTAFDCFYLVNYTRLPGAGASTSSRRTADVIDGDGDVSSRGGSDDDGDDDGAADDADDDDDDDGDEAEESKWGGWEDSDEEADATPCPFCCATMHDAAACIKHASAAHGFDLHETRHRLGLDFYGTIKLVNHVRRTAAAFTCITCADVLPNASALSQHMASASHGRIDSADAWLADASLLRPVVPDDPLLRCFEDDDDADDWSDEDDGDVADVDDVDDDDDDDGVVVVPE